ncbi:MAG: enoyl-CoA hydratase [Dehalococcoidia bacterium]|nr:enoyl-CoA hydratase [Dehalococcoidia bacterium]
MAERTYENLLIDRVGTDGRIARVTLNRPEKMNALSQELLFEFRDALEDLEADHDARVVIVRGAGRTFSAGYDLTPAQQTGEDAIVRQFKQRDDQGRRLWPGVRAGMQRITNIHMYFWNMQKVTIAQVHGYAIAGGCELSMMADLVTCADDAKFGHPGLRFAGTRTSMILPLLIGMRKAKELFYTGDNISGEEAVRVGLANWSSPVEELEDRTIAFADRIAILPADHLAMLKVHMNRFHENMGIYSSVHSSTDLDAAGGFTSQAYQWQDKMRDGGLKEALAWRDGPYQDYRSATDR